MTEYIGSSIVVSWIYSSGTATISGDYTNFTWNDTGNQVEVTAGADANVKRLTTTKDFTASMDAYFQSGTDTGGTATFNLLYANAIGTLQWQPQGTGSTFPKFSIPAICNGRNMSNPYNDKVTVSVSWNGNGALTESANS